MKLAEMARKLSNSMACRGALIVIEGCDKSGKTTQCNRLYNRLIKEKVNVELMKFPDRTTAIGEMISNYLQNQCELEDHAIHLLFSANRWELVPKMKNLLVNGTSLIVDRYAYSGVAFTAAKKGFDMDWCQQPDVGLPQPDKVVYLNLSSEAAAKRAGYGIERYEMTEFQERVAAKYQQLAKADDYWQVINADQSVEDLHNELYNIVMAILSEVQNQPLGKLWTKP